MGKFYKEVNSMDYDLNTKIGDKLLTYLQYYYTKS